MVKLLYRLVAMLVRLWAGVLAGTIFTRARRVAAREEKAPQATDRRRGWPEILLAAGLQGAILAVTKAAVDRGTASGMHKLTGVWPGDEGQRADGEGGPAGTA